MNASVSSASPNRLIAALPVQASQSLLASCDRVQIESSAVLCLPGARVSDVYFPIDSFVSLLTKLDDGSSLEVGMVGDEGMLGTWLFLGVEVAPHQALVQGAGSAWRIGTAAFKRECNDSAVLRQTINRYIQVLMSQLAQTVACTRYHLVEARLARWLLMTRDRAHCDRFALTQDFLAHMLGVRRVGITEAALSLQARGLIEYGRADINILDVRALRLASCKCYQQARRTYEETMNG